MKSFKIVIRIEDFDDVYSCKDLEQAQQIAQDKSNEIYNRLNGICTVEIKSVEEVTKIE